MDGTVLVADDDRTIRTVLTQALTRAGCRVHATSSLTTLLRWVEEGKGDLVVTDVMMPDGNGIEMLPRIKTLRPGLPVIVISAQNTIMTAIQATEAEAWDYLPKPFDLPDLLSRAGKAMESSRRGVRAPAPSQTPAPISLPEPSAAEDLPLVGRTPSMQALYRLVARVMNAELPALITGESGTGKSLIARALHDFSDRRAQPFVLASAQDFGTDQGSSGAALMARARGGSLVIDGLGDLDGPAQARLVRLLDALPADGPRIIAIADGSLTGALESGLFRHDLYYRLSGVTLHVPPLRERIEDIPLLAEHFLARAAREGGNPRRLSASALELVRQYRWPGNVRQLENVIRRLVITGQEPDITRAEMESALNAHPATSPAGESTEAGTLAESVARHVRRYFELHGADLPPPGVYQRILREVEAPLIDIALEYTGGNQARCADLLGINRNTLRKKTNELDIRVTRRRKLM
ncbi:sigma-54 dependent transcriptional regulator [Pararhodobacter zhoushanensis]|uniref:DNA-binding transcriptional regulator NtrC n=1 Tax=Pararhodobacter zhoushanensis TaxID=2479545 RepID=A0ABT3H074_9RHOB|nr:sigma-54 dependent transcriptional regulator [Pararhodobacter zhoushanensis]MCW1933206.1 sigma-54 dependent transcriptional regulator [Pararhodobacter zhoushanensis]